MNIKKELDGNKSTLLILSPVKYHSNITEIAKALKGKKICYVATNKTADSIKEEFKREKIKMKDIVIIDAISKTLREVRENSVDIYYVSTPGSLTELDLVIGKFLEHEFDYLIFDSITNLLIYQKVPQCTKFISSLLNKIAKTETKAIFYSIGNKEDELPRNISMFVEKVIDVSK